MSKFIENALKKMSEIKYFKYFSNDILYYKNSNEINFKRTNGCSQSLVVEIQWLFICKQVKLIK